MCRRDSLFVVSFLFSIFRDVEKKPLTKHESCIKCILSASGRGGVSTLYVGPWGVLVFFLILISLNPAFADIGAEWNPTGNPIGGGPGYSDSIRHQDADYIVTNKSELLNALNNAASGQIVYVADDAEIDMSGEEDVYIPGGVTLASGRGRILGDTISWGGLIYTNTHGGYTLFRPSDKNVRVTGLRFQGEFRNYREEVTPDTFDPGTGLRLFDVNQDSFEFDNCETWGVGNLGAGNYNDEIISFYVHHCYFHSTMMCVQGVPCYNYKGNAVFEANLYDYIRQNIAASGRPQGSYEARYNICLEHTSSSFDRHGYPSQGDTAGFSTVIHHNTTSQYGRVVHIRGKPVDSALVYNNWFRNSTEQNAVGFDVEENCAEWNNHCGSSVPIGLEDKIPVAVGQVSVDSGICPLSVSFSGDGSYDQDGSIAWYEWDFGDNSSTVRQSSVDHTYDEVGVYLAELTVHDNDGCVASDIMHIRVTPTSVDSYYVSFWVNDRYCGSDTGFFKKQAFLNDWKIWESDMAGYHGWEHITVNVTDSLKAWNPESVSVSFRLYCGKSITPEATIYETWWDDVAFFWGDVKNGDFEEGSVYWTYSENGTWFEGQLIKDDVRSGGNSYYIKFHKNHECEPGTWGQISQRIDIRPIGINESQSPEKGKVFSMNFPFPNPSRHGATISYQIADRSSVSLRVYDASGRLVQTLVDEHQNPGYHQVHWDGNDARGKGVANGVYFYRLVTNPIGEGDSYQATRKLVVLKK